MGNAGSIPGQGTETPHAAGQLCLCAPTAEPELWSPCTAAREAWVPQPSPDAVRNKTDILKKVYKNVKNLINKYISHITEEFKKSTKYSLYHKIS